MRIALIILSFYFVLSCDKKIKDENNFVIFKVNPKIENIAFYWKDNDGIILKSINNLKDKTQQDKKKLRFAMNGGMFEPNNFPKGLYIENFNILNKIDTLAGKGNFISSLTEYFILREIRMQKLLRQNRLEIIQTYNMPLSQDHCY